MSEWPCPPPASEHPGLAPVQGCCAKILPPPHLFSVRLGSLEGREIRNEGQEEGGQRQEAEVTKEWIVPTLIPSSAPSEKVDGQLDL